MLYLFFTIYVKHTAHKTDSSIGFHCHSSVSWNHNINTKSSTFNILVKAHLSELGEELPSASWLLPPPPPFEEASTE